ncbi:hypothetical protein UCREL1_10150 [Eutypa lata UCREL1]|uniref:DUF7704 domain-containing protein n=1 Tax=Eutypa lata (strain UCR-EL1) TaxID=1287681 RepID=M7S9U1_EUTLA|nr:hypothetical protein UCREL1_10150 [Eutypa lata UCREL1]
MAPNTASLLPLFPRIFFLYLEPIMIPLTLHVFRSSYGIYIHYSQAAPLFAVSAQSDPPSLQMPTLIGPSVSMQFIFTAMLYGLVILLSSPPNKRLLQLHIAILTLADFTHWFGIFWTLAQNDPRGWGGVLDTSAWTPELLGLMRYPIWTLAVKFATLAGWFGEIKG